MYIGEKETKWLFVILITSRIFVGGIKIFSSLSGVAGALFALVCAVVVTCAFLITDKINYGKDFFDAIKTRYGKFAVACSGAILGCISLFNCSMRLKMFSYAVTDVILPDSPEVYVVLFFAFVIFVVSCFGVEALTRYAIPAGFVIVALTLVTGVFNIESYRLSNIYPLFGNAHMDFYNLNDGISLFADVFYLFVISDFLKEKNAVKRVGIKALCISALIIIGLVLLYCLAVPYPALTKFDYPFFRLTSLANGSVLFQRLDAIVYIIWLFGGFITTGALSIFTMLIFSKGFGLSDYKGIMHIVIFMIVALAVSDKAFFLPALFFAVVVLMFSLIAFLLCRFKKLFRRVSNEN